MYYIGVDLGGTNIVVGLVHEAGNIIAKLQKPTYRNRTIRCITDDIINMCLELIKKYALSESQLIGIGRGAPGTVDRKTGTIIYAGNIRAQNFNMLAYMRNGLGEWGSKIKLAIANDADCAALGEVKVGGAKDYKNVIILTLGTGVGSGIILDGKLFSGCQPGGAELGHQIIIHNGRKCTCGNKGCLEAYTSAVALSNMAKEMAKHNPSSLLNILVKGNLEKMNARVPFEAAQQGDRVARILVDKYITYLAIGINNIINIFKPEIILIGGGVSRQKSSLIYPLRRKVKKMAFGGQFTTQIKIATLGNDAGVIGAAMLCAD